MSDKKLGDLTHSQRASIARDLAFYWKRVAETLEIDPDHVTCTVPNGDGAAPGALSTAFMKYLVGESVTVRDFVKAIQEVRIAGLIIRTGSGLEDAASTHCSVIAPAIVASLSPSPAVRTEPTPEVEKVSGLKRDRLINVQRAVVGFMDELAICCDTTMDAVLVDISSSERAVPSERARHLVRVLGGRGMTISTFVERIESVRSCTQDNAAIQTATEKALVALGYTPRPHIVLAAPGS